MMDASSATAALENSPKSAEFRNSNSNDNINALHIGWATLRLQCVACTEEITLQCPT